jgi:hypothetical protein
LAYADDVNVVEESTYNIKSTKGLLDASDKADLEVNSEKTNYMLVPRQQKAGQKRSIKTVNRSFEDVTNFRYLGTILTDQNCMHEEIKSRLNSGNACYHLVQGLVSSRQPSWNAKVKIHRTTILPVVFYGCETWCVSLTEEHSLRCLRRGF